MAPRSSFIIGAGAAVVIGIGWMLLSRSRSGEPAVIIPPSELNEAVILVKPHCYNEKVISFVKRFFEEKGLSIGLEKRWTGRAIAQAGVVDLHYATIARYATTINPADLPVTSDFKEKFAEKYSMSWEEANAERLVFNMVGIGQKFGLSNVEVAKEFDAAEPKNGLRVGPGCYMTYLPARKVFAVNGFYGQMKAEFEDAENVLAFTVRFSSKKMSWKTFRQEIIGVTNPNKSAPTSIRGLLKRKQEELGFKAEGMQNFVHGSASALEALHERCIWFDGVSVTNDTFGQLLLAAPASGGAGMSLSQVEFARQNPTVNGEPLFDLVEEEDSDVTLSKLPKLIKQ